MSTGTHELLIQSCDDPELPYISIRSSLTGFDFRTYSEAELARLADEVSAHLARNGRRIPMHAPCITPDGSVVVLAGW